MNIIITANLFMLINAESQEFHLLFYIGMLFVIALIIFIVYLQYKNKLTITESHKKFKERYDELQKTHEQLVLDHEMLDRQFEELKVTKERYKMAVAGSNDGIWDWSIQRKTVFFSDRAKEILGIIDEANVFEEDKLFKMLDEESQKNTKKHVKEHFLGDTNYFEIVQKVKQSKDTYKSIFTRGKVVKDKDGNCLRMAGSIMDIDKTKKTEEKLQKMAYCDELTGLPNRTQFYNMLNERIAQYQKTKKGFSVGCIDLDNFKMINDMLGHYYGDKALKRISDILKDYLKGKGEVARLSGDEFFLMIDIYNEKEVRDFAKGLLNLFHETFVIEEIEFYITASMGIVLVPRDAYDIVSILGYADMSMYNAKKLGKNCYSFYKKDINIQMEQRIDLERHLRKALEKHELEVYYQPKVNLKNKEIIGLEALLRWKHSTRGFIPPSVFIPIAEETGMIIEIGEWVIRQVCNHIKQWKDSGYDEISVAVNVSPRQIQEYKFSKKIKKIIEETKISPALLDFEVTESIELSDLNYAVNVLNDLIKIGVSLSLDDFGTGYSSMNYFRTLPINTLKIDKTFVDNIIENNKEKAVIDSIIQISHAFELAVVAEGVETEEQMQLLSDLGCDYAQGYYFEKPVPFETINAILSEKNNQ